MAKAWVVGLGLAAVAATAVVIYVNRATPDEAAPKPAVVDDGLPPMVGEAEREAYVTTQVKLHDLSVEPDRAPGEDGGVGPVVPGLYRVRGAIENVGDKRIEGVKLQIAMKDQDGKVISAFIEDVSQARVLMPGDRRSFKFEIPEKKEFSGEYEHKLR